MILITQLKSYISNFCLKNNSYKNLLQIHIAVFLFGSAGLFGKFLDLPSIIIVLGRVWFSSIFLLILFFMQKTCMKLQSKRHALVLILCGAILALHWTAFYQSIQVSTVAVGTLTFSTYPIFLTFLEPLAFREKIRKHEVVTSLLMFLGIILIIPKLEIQDTLTQGVMWGMVSSLTYAILNLLNRKYTAKYSGVIIAFYEQSAAAVVLLPALFIIKPVISAREIGVLFLLGVLFTAVAHSLFISGMKKVTAQTAGVISSLESVYGILFAAILLSEFPTIREIAGGIIILTSAVFSTYLTSKELRQKKDDF